MFNINYLSTFFNEDFKLHKTIILFFYFNLRLVKNWKLYPYVKHYLN